MWIESYETMAVEGFLMEARVQRSAPDEAHTLTVVETPAVEGSKQWRWSVESIYGQLVAEGTAKDEAAAKQAAVEASKQDGGPNDPEDLEQALQSTAADASAAAPDLGRMTSQAAVASEDYPHLAGVLDERPPLEHNAGRFPQDYEDDGVEVSIGESDLMEMGDDEFSLDATLASILDLSARDIYGFITGHHDHADSAYSSYNLLTSDERLSTTQRGAKAIHMYETAIK